MKTFALTASAAYLLAQATANQFVMYTGTTASDGDDNCVERADPILAPGEISQHVHQIFGSNAFAPEVTYDSLQKASCTTVGDASGNSNKADKSIYWHPALYMEAKDGSGYVRVPTLGHKFYYKDAGTGTKRQPFEFPQGFRMLAGSPFMRAPASDLQQQNITQWICHDSAGNNQGTAGGFPTGVTDCDSYPGFNGAIHFPHCWNGDDFNPADPTAHVVYPTGDIENGECPSSHPTRLPHIFAENQFNLHDMVDKVKPDTFTLAMGDNTGYGWHFDFFNGWDDGAIPKLLENCPQGEYGNEDVGTCPDFEAGPKTDQCKLKTTYVENVTNPGKNLVGCNPVSDKNPAPFYQTAPLGTYSTNCKLVSGGAAPPSSPSGGASESAPAPSASEPASSGSSPASSAGPYPSSGAVPAQSSVGAVSGSAPVASSTLVTSSKPSSTGSAPPSYSAPSGSSDISCPDSDRKTYTLNGKTFRVQCGIDHSGGDLKMVSAQSLGECAEACAKTDGCVDVSLSGTACYMKSTLGQREKNSGVNGARLVTAEKPTKPQQYDGAGGAQYFTNIHTATATATATAAHRHRHVARHAHRLSF